jgi:hypothetical protein
MNNTISIVVYPLFGSWRAECKTCGAYANSDDNKYKHPIGEALENLSKSPTTFSDASKDCSHNYGSYKPRVDCYVHAKDVAAIPQPRNISYEYIFNKESGRYEPDFDAMVSGKGRATHICAGYKYQLHVINQGISEKRIAEEKARAEEEEKTQLDALNLALSEAIHDGFTAIHMSMQKHERNLRHLKYVAVCLIIFIASLFGIGTIQQNGGIAWLRGLGF